MKKPQKTSAAIEYLFVRGGSGEVHITPNATGVPLHRDIHLLELISYLHRNGWALRD